MRPAQTARRERGTHQACAVVIEGRVRRTRTVWTRSNFSGRRQVYAGTYRGFFEYCKNEYRAFLGLKAPCRRRAATSSSHSS